MSDDHSSADQSPQPQPPAERSPQGGAKDTDDLAGIRGVQDTGMLEKAKQADQTPEDVLGTDKPIQPQRR